jgi:hypothetical protein
LAADLPGYGFFTVKEEDAPADPNQPDAKVFRATPIKLIPKVKQTIAENLYVVPESAFKGKTDMLALGLALANSATPGAHQVPPVYAEEVSDEDKRTEARVHILIKSVDPIAGLIYDRTSNDPNDPANFTGKPGGKMWGGEQAEKPKSRISWLMVVGLGFVVLVIAGVTLGIVIWMRTSKRKSEADDEEYEDGEEDD